MSLTEALRAFSEGKIIIVTDHHDRENEGDMVCSAEKITPEQVNFMTKYARGLICVTIRPEHAKKLNLVQQPKRNNNDISCSFTVSIDASCISTSGISVSDRCLTINKIARENSQASDFATPGHVFPVCAHPDGLLARHGHTEASIELCNRTGLFPAAVICEVLADDGSAALSHDLDSLSKRFNIPMISIEDLIR